MLDSMSYFCWNPRFSLPLLLLGCWLPSSSSVGHPVRINEVAVTPHHGTLELESSDWVELYNDSTNVVDLTDLSLSDSAAKPRRWTFPSGSRLGPSAYLVVLCNSVQPATTNAQSEMLNTGFGLKPTGGRVLLFDSQKPSASLIDSVSFGLQVAGYSIGRSTLSPEAWTLTIPTPAFANRDATLSDPGHLRINEWMANPRTGSDYLELFNPEPNPVSLGGLFLTDTPSLPTLSRVPELSFIGTQAAGFALFTADKRPSAGADHVNFQLSSSGDSIALFSTNGVRIDLVQFGAQDLGVASGRVPDGSTNLVTMPESPSPGSYNFLPLRSVVINEILSHADDPVEDAIELYNPSSQSVDLSGWFISDNPSKPRKFRIPAGTVIEPDGFQVFYRYQFQPHPGVAPSFGFNSAHGDDLYLFAANPDGQLDGYRTGVVFESAPNGFPFGRYVTSTGPEFVLLQRITMGSSVTPSSPPDQTPLFRLGRGAPNAAPLVGPIVIHEIGHWAPQQPADEDSEESGFIELRNLSATTTFLYDPIYPSNTVQLKGSVRYSFPTESSLPPDGVLVLVDFDPKIDGVMLSRFRQRFSIPDEVQILGPYLGELGLEKGDLALFRPDVPQFCFDPDFGFVAPILMDRVVFSPGRPELDSEESGEWSLQRRTPDGLGMDPTYWCSAFPSPGRVSYTAAGAVPTLESLPDQVINAGLDARIIAAAAETGVHYQWYREGSALAGETRPQLTLSKVSPSDAGVYSLLASNPFGSTQTRIRVRVIAAPRILHEPQDVEISHGATAKFWATVIGTPPFEYQWEKAGVVLPGATNATLTLPKVSENDLGDYRLRVSTSAGSVLSQSAQLSLLSHSPPTMVTQPKGEDFRAVTPVAAGGRFILQAQAAGEPPLHYQWRKNGAPIEGANESSLTIESFDATRVGNYDLEVTNATGRILSDPVPLDFFVFTQVAIRGPARLIVNPGDPLLLSTESVGTPRLYYQWEHNDRAIPGALCGTLERSPVQYADGGKYRVSCFNKRGEVILGTAWSEVVQVVVAPRILSVTTSGGRWQLLFEATPNSTVQVQASHDLVHWEEVDRVIAGSGTSKRMLPDSVEASTFFRLLVEESD